MHLIIKPKEELLKDVQGHVKACRQGNVSHALLIPGYLVEGGITLSELHITQEQLDAWHSAAMKLNYDS